MYDVLIIGAGKIGSLIACLLQDSGRYRVTLADIKLDGSDLSRLIGIYPDLRLEQLDIRNNEALQLFLKREPIQIIISSLPYFHNKRVAEIAKEFGMHYFDLTEDIKVTEAIRKLAIGAENIFVPQCGLAPGFVGIVANSLMQNFHRIDTVKLRVGALPENINNALHYALTWSVDGLINEYGNPCYAIEDSTPVFLLPLQGLETIKIDGLCYEAFNTSGGLGNLPDLWKGKVRSLNYKTIRYPGHCEKMRLLMEDLRMNEDRGTLKRILENAIPKTYQDVVLVYVSVSGHHHNGEYIEENYIKKIYPKVVGGVLWSAIQISTASGLCAVLDLVLQESRKYSGFLLQEQFSLAAILNNSFGKNYSNSSRETNADFVAIP